MSTATARRPDEWLKLFALSAIWGLSFPAVDLALETYPPLTISAARIGMAAIGLVIFARMGGHAFPQTARNWFFLTFVGVIGTGLPFFLISWGQQQVAPGATSILIAVMPLFTLGLSHLVGDEKLTLRALGGMLIGFVGLILLIGPEALATLGNDGDNFIFQLSILAGALCYSLSAVAARQVRDVPVVSAGAVSLVTASIVMVPAALMLEGPIEIDTASNGIWAILYLGLFATFAAEILYFTIIGQSGASFFSLINYLIPIIALIVSVSFLGEEPDVRTLLALPVILMGLWFGGQKKRD